MTGEYPPPAEGTCPPCFAPSLEWVGVRLLSVVPVKGEGVYLGKRYNFDATPHSRKPYCGHAPDRLQCEQWKGCQNPEGPDFYITLPGHFVNDRCDRSTVNAYQCHHKPLKNETGATTVCAVPAGEPPSSPRGRCTTVDVR